MPWRDLGCPYRRRAYEFVSAYWRRHLPEAELVIDGGGEGEWNLADALNAAVLRASGDVLFEIGPDGILPPESVRVAAALAAKSDGLVTCQTRNLHLTLEATNALIDRGLDVSFRSLSEADCEYAGSTSADVGCFSRATWEQAGGYEPRFGGWGGVDSAYALACDTLVAPGRRVPGTWVHLWHPILPKAIPGGPGYAEQFSLLTDYVDAAAAGPDAMRKLIGGA